MEKKKNEWKLTHIEGRQIADTGDYSDGGYELSNGEVTLVTWDGLSEVDEDGIVYSLNTAGARWYNKEDDRIDKILAEDRAKKAWEIAKMLYEAIKPVHERNNYSNVAIRDALEEYQKWA